MNGVVHAVSNLVCFLVIEGALEWSDDDADEQVLLQLGHAETFNGGYRQLRIGSLAKDRDLLDDVRVVSQFVAYTVADVLGRIVDADRDREISSYGRKVRDGSVVPQVEHLRFHPWVT
jgi:hypothetical protein